MKKYFLTILKTALTIIGVFIIPFILPSIAKILINLNFFSDFEEFKEILSTFLNLYVVIYIAIGMVLLLWFFHKWEGLKKFIDNHDFSFMLGDKSFLAKRRAEEELKEETDKKEFIDKLSRNIELTNRNTTEEVRQKLGLKGTNKEAKCKECNKNELETENKKLRSFAAYNIINTEAKTVLHEIYNEKYINKNTFKSRIIQGYIKRNKRNVKINKKDIEKIANNKYETIYNGLKYLNIIEPSEDDKTIKLTQVGKKFVEEYIEKE